LRSIKTLTNEFAVNYKTKFAVIRIIHSWFLLANPHSTGRLMLAAKMKDFSKIMMRALTKDLRINSPSTSGEFIRWLAI